MLTDPWNAFEASGGRGVVRHCADSETNRRAQALASTLFARRAQILPLTAVFFFWAGLLFAEVPGKKIVSDTSPILGVA